MSRHGKERTPTEQSSNRNQPLSSRLMENDNSDERNHVFKGPDDEKKVIFDPKELKKITVKILRKNPQTSVPSLRREIFNPATVAPVRRPDEGKRPIFARKELQNFVSGDNVPEGESPSKPSNEKRKKDSASPPQAPRTGDKSRRRSRSRSRTRSRTPRRHHSHSPSEPNSSRRSSRGDRERSHSPHSDYSRRKEDRRHKSDYKAEKYEKRHSSSSSERRRSKDRSRSPQSPPRHRRGRSYRSRSGSRYRSRSRSYERRRRSRTRSHSRGRRRRSPHSRDRDFSDHYPVSRFIQEREYLKALRRKQKEEDDKRLKEEALRRKEKAEQEANQIVPKDAALEKEGKVSDHSHGKPSTSKEMAKHEGGGGGRMRGPPRMRPPMVHFRPMMVPFPIYPPPHPMFRPPPFRPYPPFRPPNPRFHHPEY